MTDYTIEDLQKTYSEISSIRDNQKFIIKDLIKNGLAKSIYFIDGIDGYYGQIKLTHCLVTSNDRNFIKNLHHVLTSLDEDLEYYDFENEIIFAHDAQYFGDIPYMRDIEITPFGK